VTADSRYFYIPHRYRGEIKIYIIKYGGSRDCMVGMGSYMEIFEARVLGENLYLRQRFTVFKVEYFLYIIQVMLQYTPSFNKVNYSNPSMFTKLSHKQESVTADSRYFYIPHRYRGEIKIYIIKYGGSRDCMVVEGHFKCI
jgi:DNA-directed RNA polymerase subunit L